MAAGCACLSRRVGGSFPNCYFLYGPNTNLGHNSILFMVERQINLILQALALQTRAGRTGGTGDLPTVGVTDDSYRLDDERTQRLMAGTAWVAGCRSWYKDASGRVVNNWPTWTVRYWYDTLRLRTHRLGLVPTRTGRPSVTGSRRRRNPSTPPARRVDANRPAGPRWEAPATS